MDSESPHNLSADPRIDSLEEDPGDPNREDPLLESGLPQPVAIPRMDSSQQVNTVSYLSFLTSSFINSL